MTGNDDKLAVRIEEITGWKMNNPVVIITDTSDWLGITRGNVIRLDNRDFVVKGNEYEKRFGIEDQPKYWVFNVYDLENGRQKIIKTVFHEDFHVHIGIFKIHCFRSPEKEAKVLELVKDDGRFMHGETIPDTKGNQVRIIDFIRGKTFFQYVFNIPKKHEQYFAEDLPAILWKLTGCFEAIAFLHEHKLCHGDIRNDHILMEAETGHYRWIDFDLNQNVSDFDVWSIGNIINYAVGKGITAFSNVLKSRDISPEVKASLVPDDASGFFEYRLMNLAKLHPYIPPRLSAILRHFTIRPEKAYLTMRELLDDWQEMLAAEFPSGAGEK